MRVNFFKEDCKCVSRKRLFGLCDDEPPPHVPAYIDEDNSEKWIGIVNNPNNYGVDFFAIDHCVNFPKETVKCDGVLMYDKKLIFVELKSRKRRSDWLKSGINQLKETLRIFQKNYDVSNYETIGVQVCNNKRPLFNIDHTKHIAQFKKEVGIVLRTEQEILIK